MDSGGSGGVTKVGDQRSAENRGGFGDRIPPSGYDGGCNSAVTSYALRSSLASTASRGKKRRLMPAVPDVSEDLAQEVRTSSAADVNAEFNRHIATIMRVAMTSTNLKGTYIKDLRDAATYITAAWKYDAPRRMGAAQGSATTKLAEARMTALEEENAALRQELSRRAACAHECPRCTGSVSVPGHVPREDGSRVERPDAHSRIDALEEKFDRLLPSILSAKEERFGGRKAVSSESRNTAGLSNTRCATQTPAPPREQRSGEWKVVESKKSRKKRKKEDNKKAAASGEQTKKAPLPPPKTIGAPKSYAAAAAMAKKGSMKSS
jgi:hypothetical protein